MLGISSSISDRPLQTNFWDYFPPASAFGQQSSSLRSTLPAQHVRPSGFFCCWTDSLELTARRHAGSGVFCGQLQTFTEDFLFILFSTNVFSALEVCYENALFTFDIDIDIAALKLTSSFRWHRQGTAATLREFCADVRWDVSSNTVGNWLFRSLDTLICRPISYMIRRPTLWALGRVFTDRRNNDDSIMSLSNLSSEIIVVGDLVQVK